MTDPKIKKDATALSSPFEKGGLEGDLTNKTGHRGLSTADPRLQEVMDEFECLLFKKCVREKTEYFINVA